MCVDHPSVLVEVTITLECKSVVASFCVPPSASPAAAVSTPIRWLDYAEFGYITFRPREAHDIPGIAQLTLTSRI